MHHCLYSEQPHSLAFLVSIYCHEPFFKMMAKEASDVDYQVAHWEYNALDVVCTLEAFHKLRGELKHYGLEEFYLSYYAPLSRTLAIIQSRGLLLDKDTRDSLKAKLTIEVEAIQSRINELAEQDINPNSPKQMKEYVYGVLRLPEQRKRGTRAVTTDDKALSTLRRKYPRHEEFINLCLEARGKRKSIGTFLKSFEDLDGRVRTSYNIAGNSRRADATGGAETGRLSSSTNIYGRGTNLQNQPKWARELYVPDPDWVFWQADLSSAESYIVAWDSGDEAMFKILTNHSLYGEGRPDRIYYHEFIGSLILGIKPEEVVGDLRDLAKTVGHGYNYSMGPRTLTENVNNRQPHLRFTQTTAKDCFRSLDNNLQGLVSWRHRIKSTIRQTRRLKNCFGRQRIFFGRMEDATYREAYAFLPQSSIGDTVNLSLIELERRFDGRTDLQILGQVHDSIFGQCKPDALDFVRSNVVEVLQRELPMSVYGVPLRIPCEFKTGANWKETS
jgi:DNA polymerase-1